MSGRLIAVVGPSGVGKDSVMRAMVAADPSLHLVRRVITRAPELGGEDYDAVDVATFERRAAKGDFALHWGAHGLFYGIPMDVLHKVEAGADCVANLSRAKLAEAARVFPALKVLNITATPETLAKRLAARGRESGEEITRRLAQASKTLPHGLDVTHIANDGVLQDTVTQALAALRTKTLVSEETRP